MLNTYIYIYIYIYNNKEWIKNTIQHILNENIIKEINTCITLEYYTM